MKWSPVTPVYYYHFNHVSSYSFADVFGQGPIEIAFQVALKTFGIHKTLGLGVCHEDDNLHLFTADALPYRRLDPNNEPDKATTALMVDLWANFAEYGEPTPKGSDGSFIGSSLSQLGDPWRHIAEQVQEPYYATIDKGTLAVDAIDTEFDDRMDFWDQILANYTGSN